MDITRERLAHAIGRMGQIGIKGTEQSCGNAYGEIQYPWAVADCILGFLRDDRGPAEGVVDAHICCDHAGTDPDVSLADIAGSHADTELALMAAILHGMEQLAPDARQRIRNWVDERFVPRGGLCPF